MSKILININSTALPFFGPHAGYISGVGRSTQSLMKALAKVDDPDVRIETILESHRHWGKYRQGFGCSHHWTVLPYTYSHLFRRFLNYDLYHYPDNYFASYFSGEKFILTVHDTIQYEEAVAAKDFDRIRLIEKNVKDCQGVITCSDYSKRRILEHFDVEPAKISVIPWGVDTQLFKKKTPHETEQTLSQFNIRTPYFLAVSCREERKNMRNLLKAFRQYSKSHKCSLVLIWGNPPADIISEYSEEIYQENLLFLGYVTDEQLVDLYNGATGTLFPSRQEGFGFPIIESYACGTPVMTCRNSSLEEVGGSFAQYVGEDDIDGMVAVMTQMEMEDKAKFQKTIVDYVTGFSWETTALKYIEYYKSICSKTVNT